VHRGRHRAYLLARCVLAVLAHHRGKGEARFFGGAREVAVYADPVHLPPLGHLLGPHHRDVVLRLASHHAGTAADARRQVYHHPPLVLAGKLPLLPGHGGAELGSFLRWQDGVLGPHFPHQLPQAVTQRLETQLVNGLLVLGGNHLPCPAGSLERNHRQAPTHRCHPWQRHAHPVPHPTRCLPAVTGHQPQGAFRHAGQQERWQYRLAPFPRHAKELLVPHPQRLGGSGPQEHGVAPGELGDGLRELLEPRVVGKPPVQHLAVRHHPGGELGFLRKAQRREPAGVNELHCHRGSELFAPHPVVEGLAESLLPIGSPDKRREALPHQLVAASFLPQHEREQLLGGLATVQRGDERLHHRVHALGAAQVPPPFQEMRLGQVPVGEPGGFVLVKPEPNQALGPPEVLLPAQFPGGGACRVAPQHQQQLHLPAGKRFPERIQRSGPRSLHGGGVTHGGPHPSQGQVHGEAQGMAGGGQCRSHRHEASPPGPGQVPGRRGHERPLLFRKLPHRRKLQRKRHADLGELLGQSHQQLLQPPWRCGQAQVRGSAGDGGDRLRHEEAQRVLRIPAPFGVSPGVGHRLGVAEQQIVPEAGHHPGPAQLQVRHHGNPRGLPQPGKLLPAHQRVPVHPAGPGERSG